jgi:sterol 14-demethylase
MRVVVDLDLCGGHGVCQGEAPEIFRVVDAPGGYAHVEVLLERPPEALRAAAKAAERLCPNRVIRIVED